MYLLSLGCLSLLSMVNSNDSEQDVQPLLTYGLRLLILPADGLVGVYFTHPLAAATFLATWRHLMLNCSNVCTSIPPQVPGQLLAPIHYPSETTNTVSGNNKHELPSSQAVRSLSATDRVNAGCWSRHLPKKVPGPQCLSCKSGHRVIYFQPLLKYGLCQRQYSNACHRLQFLLPL